MGCTKDPGTIGVHVGPRNNEVREGQASNSQEVRATAATEGTHNAGVVAADGRNTPSSVSAYGDLRTRLRA